MQINRYWYWDPFCVEEETHFQSNHTKWITEVLNNLQKLGNAFYNRNEITARKRNPIMLRVFYVHVLKVKYGPEN